MTENTKKIIIDGTNATMGRLASFVAKQALYGKEIVVVNADNVLISGDKRTTLKKYQERIKRGGASLKGQKIVRTSERILKRTIRGMLSHKQGRGNDALKRVRCYNTIPKEYEASKKILSGRKKGGKTITLKELVKLIK